MKKRTIHYKMNKRHKKKKKTISSSKKRIQYGGALSGAFDSLSMPSVSNFIGFPGLSTGVKIAIAGVALVAIREGIKKGAKKVESILNDERQNIIMKFKECTKKNNMNVRQEQDPFITLNYNTLFIHKIINKENFLELSGSDNFIEKKHDEEGLYEILDKEATARENDEYNNYIEQGPTKNPMEGGGLVLNKWNWIRYHGSQLKQMYLNLYSFEHSLENMDNDQNEKIALLDKDLIKNFNITKKILKTLYKNLKNISNIIFNENYNIVRPKLSDNSITSLNNWVKELCTAFDAIIKYLKSTADHNIQDSDVKIKNYNNLKFRYDIIVDYENKNSSYKPLIKQLFNYYFLNYSLRVSTFKNEFETKMYLKKLKDENGKFQNTRKTLRNLKNKIVRQFEKVGKTSDKIFENMRTTLKYYECENILCNQYKAPSIDLNEILSSNNPMRMFLKNTLREIHANILKETPNESFKISFLDKLSSLLRIISFSDKPEEQKYISNTEILASAIIPLGGLYKMTGDKEIEDTKLNLKPDERTVDQIVDTLKNLKSKGKLAATNYFIEKMSDITVETRTSERAMIENFKYIKSSEIQLKRDYNFNAWDPWFSLLWKKPLPKGVHLPPYKIDIKEFVPKNSEQTKYLNCGVIHHDYSDYASKINNEQEYTGETVKNLFKEIFNDYIALFPEDYKKTYVFQTELLKGGEQYEEMAKALDVLFNEFNYITRQLLNNIIEVIQIGDYIWGLCGSTGYYILLCYIIDINRIPTPFSDTINTTTNLDFFKKIQQSDNDIIENYDMNEEMIMKNKEILTIIKIYATEIFDNVDSIDWNETSVRKDILEKIILGLFEKNDIKNLQRSRGIKRPFSEEKLREILKENSVDDIIKFNPQDFEYIDVDYKYISDIFNRAYYGSKKTNINEYVINLKEQKTEYERRYKVLESTENISDDIKKNFTNEYEEFCDYLDFFEKIEQSNKLYGGGILNLKDLKYLRHYDIIGTNRIMPKYNDYYVNNNYWLHICFGDKDEEALHKKVIRWITNDTNVTRYENETDNKDDILNEILITILRNLTEEDNNLLTIANGEEWDIIKTEIKLAISKLLKAYSKDDTINNCDNFVTIEDKIVSNLLTENPDVNDGDDNIKLKDILLEEDKKENIVEYLKTKFSKLDEMKDTEYSDDKIEILYEIYDRAKDAVEKMNLCEIYFKNMSTIVSQLIYIKEFHKSNNKAENKAANIIYGHRYIQKITDIKWNINNKLISTISSEGGNIYSKIQNDINGKCDYYKYLYMDHLSKELYSYVGSMKTSEYDRLKTITQYVENIRHTESSNSYEDKILSIGKIHDLSNIRYFRHYSKSTIKSWTYKCRLESYAHQELVDGITGRINFSILSEDYNEKPILGIIKDRMIIFSIIMLDKYLNQYMLKIYKLGYKTHVEKYSNMLGLIFSDPDYGKEYFNNIKNIAAYKSLQESLKQISDTRAGFDTILKTLDSEYSDLDDDEKISMEREIQKNIDELQTNPSIFLKSKNSIIDFVKEKIIIKVQKVIDKTKDAINSSLRGDINYYPHIIVSRCENVYKIQGIFIKGKNEQGDYSTEYEIEDINNHIVPIINGVDISNIPNLKDNFNIISMNSIANGEPDVKIMINLYTIIVKNFLGFEYPIGFDDIYLILGNEGSKYMFTLNKGQSIDNLTLYNQINNKKYKDLITSIRDNPPTNEMDREELKEIVKKWYITRKEITDENSRKLPGHITTVGADIYYLNMFGDMNDNPLVCPRKGYIYDHTKTICKTGEINHLFLKSERINKHKDKSINDNDYYWLNKGSFIKHMLTTRNPLTYLGDLKNHYIDFKGGSVCTGNYINNINDICVQLHDTDQFDESANITNFQTIIEEIMDTNNPEAYSGNSSFNKYFSITPFRIVSSKRIFDYIGKDAGDVFPIITIRPGEPINVNNATAQQKEEIIMKKLIYPYVFYLRLILEDYNYYSNREYISNIERQFHLNSGLKLVKSEEWAPSKKPHGETKKLINDQLKIIFAYDKDSKGDRVRSYKQLHDKPFNLDEILQVMKVHHLNKKIWYGDPNPKKIFNPSMEGTFIDKIDDYLSSYDPEFLKEALREGDFTGESKSFLLKILVELNKAEYCISDSYPLSSEEDPSSELVVKGINSTIVRQILNSRVMAGMPNDKKYFFAEDEPSTNLPQDENMEVYLVNNKMKNILKDIIDKMNKVDFTGSPIDNDNCDALSYILRAYLPYHSDMKDKLIYFLQEEFKDRKLTKLIHSSSLNISSDKIDIYHRSNLFEKLKKIYNIPEKDDKKLKNAINKTYNLIMNDLTIYSLENFSDLLSNILFDSEYQNIYYTHVNIKSSTEDFGEDSGKDFLKLSPNSTPDGNMKMYVEDIYRNTSTVDDSTYRLYISIRNQGGSINKEMCFTMKLYDDEIRELQKIMTDEVGDEVVNINIYDKESINKDKSNTCKKIYTELSAMKTKIDEKLLEYSISNLDSVSLSTVSEEKMNQLNFEEWLNYDSILKKFSLKYMFSEIEHKKSNKELKELLLKSIWKLYILEQGDDKKTYYENLFSNKKADESPVADDASPVAEESVNILNSINIYNQTKKEIYNDKTETDRSKDLIQNLDTFITDLLKYLSKSEDNILDLKKELKEQIKERILKANGRQDLDNIKAFLKGESDGEKYRHITVGFTGDIERTFDNMYSELEKLGDESIPYSNNPSSFNILKKFTKEILKILEFTPYNYDVNTIDTYYETGGKQKTQEELSEIKSGTIKLKKKNLEDEFIRFIIEKTNEIIQSNQSGHLSILFNEDSELFNVIEKYIYESEEKIIHGQTLTIPNSESLISKIFTINMDDLSILNVLENDKTIEKIKEMYEFCGKSLNASVNGKNIKGIIGDDIQKSIGPIGGEGAPDISGVQPMVITEILKKHYKTLFEELYQIILITTNKIKEEISVEDIKESIVTREDPYMPDSEEEQSDDIESEPLNEIERVVSVNMAPEIQSEVREFRFKNSTEVFLIKDNVDVIKRGGVFNTDCLFETQMNPLQPKYKTKIFGIIPANSVFRIQYLFDPPNPQRVADTCIQILAEDGRGGFNDPCRNTLKEIVEGAITKGRRFNRSNNIFVDMNKSGEDKIGILTPSENSKESKLARFGWIKLSTIFPDMDNVDNIQRLLLGHEYAGVYPRKKPNSWLKFSKQGYLRLQNWKSIIGNNSENLYVNIYRKPRSSVEKDANKLSKLRIPLNIELVPKGGGRNKKTIGKKIRKKTRGRKTIGKKIRKKTRGRKTIGKKIRKKTRNKKTIGKKIRKKTGGKKTIGKKSRK